MLEHYDRTKAAAALSSAGDEDSVEGPPVPLVAKRKVRETWREAVVRRAGDPSPTLARFDALCAEGRDEADAAYRALEEAALLWLADEPGAATPTSAPPDDVPAV